MTDKLTAALGLLATLLFVASAIIFASLQPAFSPAEQALTSLAYPEAHGAYPYSVLGLVLPGLLISGFGVGLAVWLKRGGETTSSGRLILAAGLCLAAYGLFPATGADELNAREILAAILLLASGLLFVTGAVGFGIAARTRDQWQIPAYAAIILGLLFLSTFFLGFLDFPAGLAQHLAFLFEFCWIVLVSIMLGWEPSPVAPQTDDDDKEGDGDTETGKERPMA